MPDVPAPDELEQSSWTATFDRHCVPPEHVTGGSRDGAGRTVAWMRVHDDLGDPSDPAAQLMHRCWLAYLSDDLPMDAVIRAHPQVDEADPDLFCASLDHAIWFHRPLRADRWHLHDFACHHFVGGRGLSIGHIFSDDGVHVATVAQEVLVRKVRDRSSTELT